MDYLLSKLATIGPFLLLLGVLIFIHEWGHFIVARICGVRVETFSIGFGPKLLKWKWGDTDYCLSLIPLGGYVKMYGDGLEDDVPEEQKPESFTHQSIFEKIAIVSAGPLMNLIFAFLLFILHGKIGIPQVLPVLGDIEVNSPAYASGLLYNDKITAVNQTKIKNYAEFTKALNEIQNTSSARLEITRNKESVLVLAPIEEIKNTNPLVQKQTINTIKGISLLRASNKVGVSHLSPLFKKGIESLEKITSVNGTPVKDLHQIKKEIRNTPFGKSLTLTFQKNKGESLSLSVEPPKNTPWSFGGIGLKLPDVFIGQVQKGSAADEAGLKKNDELLQINNIFINTWTNLLLEVKSTKPNESVQIKVARKGQVLNLSMKPRQTEIITPSGKIEYRPTIGITSSLEFLPPQKSFTKLSGLSQPLLYAKKMTAKWTAVTLKGFKKLFTGEISHKTLSGVISIGKVARASLDIGWSYFIQMMAIISINLFLLNLLPIPVLDGGHLLFYFIELIKGSPVSLKTKLIGQQIGLVLLLSLMAYTIFNDLSRIVFSGW